MRLTKLGLAAVVAGSVAACSGGSGSNPFGSFGSGGSMGSIGSLNPFGSSEEVDSTGRPVIQDPTVLIERLESVVPEPALRGLILRATAIAATEGYHTAQFVAQNEGLPDENGIVTFEFRAIPPASPGRVGPEQTRRIVAATFIPDNDLVGIRGFAVIARTNTVNLRR